MSYEPEILDLSDPGVKMRLIERIMWLQGLYEVHIRQRFRGRTLPQNAYYWVAVVPAAMSVLSEAWGRPIGSDDAHEVLKSQFLSREDRLVNDDTGEVKILRYVQSTTKLDVKEFTEYLELCKDWLADWFGVNVP